MSEHAVSLGVLWVGTSAIFSTYANSLFLKTFNDAFAHTFVRFAFSGGLGLAWLAAIDRTFLLSFPATSRRLLLPSVMLLFANLMNSMGMLRSGITMTYVVKSLIPFFTVIICRIRGQQFNNVVYMSLIPVCAGVSLASATDLDFDWTGLACAMISTLCQTMLNVTSREKITGLGISGAQAFVVMASTCAVLTVPLLFVSYHSLPQGLARLLVGDGAPETPQSGLSFPRVVFLASLAYAVEYQLNFLFVPLCSSLTFSVTDILRRLSTIAFGALLFAKPLSPLNVAGIGLSLAGVSAYTIASNSGGAKHAPEPPAAGKKGA